MDSALLLAESVMREAPKANQRPGQYLFNHILPGDACRVIVGTTFDPFNKEMTFQELKLWIDNHLILNMWDTIAVFNGDDILWEAK